MQQDGRQWGRGRGCRGSILKLLLNYFRNTLPKVISENPNAKVL